MAESVVALVLSDRLRRIHEDLKKEARAQEDATAVRSTEVLYLNRLARYVGALIGVGLRGVKDSQFFTWEELLTSSDKFEAVVGNHEKVARTLVLDEFEERKQRRDEVRTEYNFARNQEIWDKLRAKMEQRLVSGLI